MNTLKNYILGFHHYKALLYELVSRDIKVRYKRSILGLLWTIINPILFMIVMTLVFSNLFHNEIENFNVYFLTGNIMFSFFNEASTNALHSVVDSGNLIKKVYIPKYLFPFSKVMSSVVNVFFSMIALLLVMFVMQVPLRASLLLAPLVIFYLIMFSLGIGLILSTVMVFFRDIAQLYSIITLLWMYLTPIFYPIELLEEAAPWALAFNPLYRYIGYFRELVLDGTIPGIQENIICFAIAFITLMIGLMFFYRKQDKFILYI